MIPEAQRGPATIMNNVRRCAFVKDIIIYVLQMPTLAALLVRGATAPPLPLPVIVSACDSPVVTCLLPGMHCCIAGGHCSGCCCPFPSSMAQCFGLLINIYLRWRMT